MYGNGVAIGMLKIIIKTAPQKTRKDQIQEITEWAVAAVGASVPSTVVLLIAATTSTTTSVLALASATLASAWLGLPSN